MTIQVIEGEVDKLLEGFTKKVKQSLEHLIKVHNVDKDESSINLDGSTDIQVARYLMKLIVTNSIDYIPNREVNGAIAGIMIRDKLI